MGLDEWLAKVSWLGKLVSVFWWVELDLFSLDAMKCPVVSFELSTTPVFLPGKSCEQRSLTGYMQSIGSQRVGHH